MLSSSSQLVLCCLQIGERRNRSSSSVQCAVCTAAESSVAMFSVQCAVWRQILQNRLGLVDSPRIQNQYLCGRPEAKSSSWELIRRQSSQSVDPQFGWNLLICLKSNLLICQLNLLIYQLNQFWSKTGQVWPVGVESLDMELVLISQVPAQATAQKLFISDLQKYFFYQIIF